MPWPNFLIIGAPEGETTPLAKALCQHPQIYLDASFEPRFFAFENQKPDYQGPGDQNQYQKSIITNSDDYLALFSRVGDRPAVGEKSPAYMYYGEQAAEHIQHYIPEVRLIAILRNPAERAYANYLRMVRDGWETLSFAQALDAEDTRVRANWSPFWRYTRRGFYAAQLEHFFQHFDSCQIYICTYDDWLVRPHAILSEIFSLLGVDASFLPGSFTLRKASSLFQNRMFYRSLSKTNWIKNLTRMVFPAKLYGNFSAGLKNRLAMQPPELDPGLRRQLVELYRTDILKLQRLLGRDFSYWLEP